MSHKFFGDPHVDLPVASLNSLLQSLINQYFQSGVMARLGIEMLAISEMTEFLVSPSPDNIKKQGAVIKAEVEKTCSFIES